MRSTRRGSGFGELWLWSSGKRKGADENAREKAFASSEFRAYNPRVEYHVSKFIEVIRKTGGKEVNAEKMLENLVFDM